MRPFSTETLDGWIAALERRHLARLTFAELRRAVRALSVRYVEQRRPDRALDGAGKRAAFALYYAPLHVLATRHVATHLGAHDPAPAGILDLGCGTGAAGAGWALACRADARPRLAGVDRSRWAATEATWTWSHLGLIGRAVPGDLTTRALPAAGAGILAAWALNELAPGSLEALRSRLISAAHRGARVLVIEPLAASATPWWEDWAAAFESAGGRADTWKFHAELPSLVRALDRAAGLDHSQLKARSLYLSG